MKNLAFGGILIALFTASHMSAGTADKPVKSEKTPVFTDCPKTTETDPNSLRAVLAVTPSTIEVNGSGGYNINTGVACPDPGSSHCATIVTAFVDGTWGPDAILEDAAARRYFGVIDSPIEDEDGNVINFKFSSLTPIE
jgi:hypothetical protein